MPRHVLKGDTVIVTSGNDRGATGEVLRVLTKADRVVVQGINIRAKHLKPTQANPQGGIVRREMPIHISNVSPVVDGKPTRVCWVIKPDGSKARVAVANGKELHTLHGARGEAGGPKKKAKTTSKTGTRTTAKTGTRTKKK